jgi:hypothetical protein
VQLYSIFDLGTRRGEGSASHPGRTLPAGKTRYTLYRRLGGPQGRSGQVRKISPLPGFDPRTVQPVGSRYTDYATRPMEAIIKAENCGLLHRSGGRVGRVHVARKLISVEVLRLHFTLELQQTGHSHSVCRCSNNAVDIRF